MSKKSDIFDAIRAAEEQKKRTHDKKVKIINNANQASNSQHQRILERLAKIIAIVRRSEQIANVDAPNALMQEWQKQSANLVQIFGNLDVYADNEQLRMLTRGWDDPYWGVDSMASQAGYIPNIGGLAPGIIRIGDLHLSPLVAQAHKVPALVAIRAHSQNLIDGKRGHITITSHNQLSRQSALGGVQSIALQTICHFPVRKLRGIFIDPIGMGNNFPLKNFPEAIVGNKVYTRSDDIREQLRALTIHIEQVIQKYLSADYETIEDFNEAKSFIKEPYRYVFIADFPTGFDTASLEDLKSLLINGARAGVYVVLHLDQTLDKPRNFDYSTFNVYTTVVQSLDKSHQQKPVFKLTMPNQRDFLVTLDAPPSNEQINALSKTISQSLREVKIETVPFVELRPAPDEEWSAPSHIEIRAPIGVSGALDRIEFWMGHNEDGKISSQGLLAGKPGAGKSYTLHAIIANLAMRYSPDQLEMYLLDFKEGVEFQIYVDPRRSETDNPYEELNESMALPHAKVISIDSDREFGLSVLKRIKLEIENRGKKFQSIGVQSLKEYRERLPDSHMPRVLVVIDEFQYLFLQNDEITRELNPIFEDITRRGRAFGIHLLLATQSPNVANMTSGIYSFIDLRMAMQMDKRSASAVLAEGNVDSIELIEGPGEIIYNANGGAKGYNIFGQVVDMSLETRKHALLQVQHIAQKHGYKRPAPLILFNGLQATRLKRNPQLQTLSNHPQWLPARELNKQVIQDPDWSVDEHPGVMWLGEAMRIGNHTHSIVRRRPRSNMVLVGSSEETIYGILSGCLISLVHCYAPKTAQFYLVDLSQVDEENHWASMMTTFRNHFQPLFDIQLGKRTPNPDEGVVRYQQILQLVYQEFERRKALRDANPDTTDFGQSVFFVMAIGGLNRAQSLRPVMGTRAEQPSEDGQLLVKLVATGPELGIHTLLWLDNMKSFTKLNGEDRTWLNHFDLRVCLNLSPADSQLLLGGAQHAQDLPRLRALFRDDASSAGLEKFKPYSVPTEAEIVHYAHILTNRK